MRFFLVKMLRGLEQVMPYEPTKPLGKATGTFTEQMGDSSDYGAMAAIAKHLLPVLGKDANKFILCGFDGNKFEYWVRRRGGHPESK